MSLFFKRSLLAVVLLAVALPAAADTLVLQDVDDMDDTYFYTNENVAQGGNTGIQVGNKSWICHGLMRFDLSSIPTGSTINSASLELSTQSARTDGVDLSFHYITADWTESEATTYYRHNDGVTPVSWTTAGGDYDPTAALTFTDMAATGGWEHETLDVATMIQAWVSGTQANNGLLMRFVVEGSGDDQNFWYASSEQHGGEEPILTIDYTVPEPATMSLLGMGGLAMLIRRKRK